MQHQDGLDLVAYLDSALGHHCPLCFFLELDTNNPSVECPHQSGSTTTKDLALYSKPLPHVPTYARSTTSSAGFSFTKSVDTVIARVSVSDSYSSETTSSTQKALRRKSLPQGTNLRELNVRHSDETLSKSEPKVKIRNASAMVEGLDEGIQRMRNAQQRLRVQQSDERLRRLYEDQMMSYLDSPLAEFSPFNESEGG